MVKLPKGMCHSAASWWGKYNGEPHTGIIYVNGVQGKGVVTYPSGRTTHHGEGKDDGGNKLCNEFSDPERPRYLGVHESFHLALALPMEQRPLVAVFTASSWCQSEYKLLGFYKVKSIEQARLEGEMTAVYTHFVGPL